MKKQIKKLKLNKSTISNLAPAEMNKHLGGAAPTNGGNCNLTHFCTKFCDSYNHCTKDCG